MPWRAVAAGLALEVALALVCLKLPGVKSRVPGAERCAAGARAATQAGTSLVFGYLGGGASRRSRSSAPEATFVLAFRALPIVLVISALSALLFYWRVLPAVVRAHFVAAARRPWAWAAWSGLSTAANVFVGMVEAPLFVRPYLARVSRGELFAIMVAGMASIAGTVLFLYGSILGPVLPDAVAHLLIASILSAPAALALAFVMVPPRARRPERRPGAALGGEPAAWTRSRAARSRARSSCSTSSRCWWCSSRWSRSSTW